MNRLRALIAMLAVGLFSTASSHAATLLAQTTFGGSGIEVGTGVAVTSSGVFFAGRSDSIGEGLIGGFDTGLGATPAWSRSWPGDSASMFSGVAAVGSSLYVSGRSYRQTTDTVGGKEGKGISVMFNANGSSGSAVGGAVWSRQTPAAPGGFSYGGHEWLTRITTATESGQTFLYTAGLGQQNGALPGNGVWGVFVSKLDATGTVLWSNTASTPTSYGVSSGVGIYAQPAIVATGESIFVGSRDDRSGRHPYLNKYDLNGQVLWSRTSNALGDYVGLASAGGNVYAVGQTDVAGPNPNFLVESWDGAGNLLWSRTYDRGLAEDILRGVVYKNGHLFAVGSTKGGSVGGTDAVLLDINASDGALLDTILWGGAADDVFNDVAILGSTVYAVGSTKSFGAGGTDIAIVSFASVPEPSSYAMLVVGLGVLCFAASRRERKCA